MRGSDKRAGTAPTAPPRAQEDVSPELPPIVVEPFITARAVAELLGVTPRWVMDKARAGKLPSRKLPGSNRVRFLSSEIRASLAEGGG
ncbi:MAG: helix-turn-helix transcriptional regulator [Gaiellaceae bacterium]